MSIESEIKRTVVEQLLAFCCPYLYIDETVEGLEGFPADFLALHKLRGGQCLVLRLGRTGEMQIPDLALDEAGFSCTLSVHPRLFFVKVPWEAVVLLESPLMSARWTIANPELGPTLEVDSAPQKKGFTPRIVK